MICTDFLQFWVYLWEGCCYERKLIKSAVDGKSRLLSSSRWTTSTTWTRKVWLHIEIEAKGGAWIIGEAINAAGIRYVLGTTNWSSTYYATQVDAHMLRGRCYGAPTSWHREGKDCKMRNYGILSIDEFWREMNMAIYHASHKIFPSLFGQDVQESYPDLHRSRLYGLAGF